VITLGRRARPEHVLVPAAELARRQIAVRPASRGGEVTFHGPGQLVGYPVFPLRKGVVDHMESMAAALVALLAGLGVEARWRRDRPGLWVGEGKIAAFGVHVRHRVAIHGFALNVSTELDNFAAIVPCGLPGGAVTSVAALVGKAPAVETLAAPAAAGIARAFALELSATREPLPD
jgi:lipoyl(octanoyl) transferase